MLIGTYLEVHGPGRDPGLRWETRDTFWQRFLAAKRDRSATKDDDRHKPDGDDRRGASELEAQFISQFPIRLQDRINEELRRSFGASRTGRQAPTIALKVVRVDYGSLHALLELTGVDDASLRDFVMSVLTFYTPSAFREAMDAPYISMSDNVELVADDLEMLATSDLVGSRLSASAKASDSLNRAWFIANTSLVVPVLLALAICYYTFSALTHEFEASRVQASAMQADRAEMVKVLQTQNAKLSDLLITHAGNADKALSEILVALAKSPSDRSVTPAKSITGNP